MLTKSSNINDDLWKDTDVALTSVMLDTDNEKDVYTEFVNSVYNVKTSARYAEKTSSLTSVSEYQVTKEGEAAPKDDIQQGFSKLIEHVTFSKQIGFSEEMKQDGKIDEMKATTAGLVNGYKQTRGALASAVLWSTGTTVSYGGSTFDTTCGDGKALFATDHPGKKSGVAAQSNVFVNAFGSDSTILNKLAVYGRNLKNQSGNKQFYTFDTIILPSNTGALEDLVRKIIASELAPGTPNNDINTQKGKWKLVIDPYYEAASGTSPYLIMSSAANKTLLANLFYDRMALDIRNWIDEPTRNLNYSGMGRCSAGMRDFRHVIKGGADAGSTMS